MKRKQWMPLGIGIAAASFTLSSAGRVLAAGSAGELAKILEAGRVAARQSGRSLTLVLRPI